MPDLKLTPDEEKLISDRRAAAAAWSEEDLKPEKWAALTPARQAEIRTAIQQNLAG